MNQQTDGQLGGTIVYFFQRIEQVIDESRGKPENWNKVKQQNERKANVTWSTTQNNTNN